MKMNRRITMLNNAHFDKSLYFKPTFLEIVTIAQRFHDIMTKESNKRISKTNYVQILIFYNRNH